MCSAKDATVALGSSSTTSPFSPPRLPIARAHVTAVTEQDSAGRSLLFLPPDLRRAAVEASLFGGGGKGRPHGSVPAGERRWERGREGRRGGRPGGGRERVTDRRRRGQVRPGGWWRLESLLDPSSTSPLPNMEHRSRSMGSMFCGSRFASFLRRSRSKAYVGSSMLSLEFTLCP